MNDNPPLKRILRRLSKVAMPAERLLISEWADKYAYLPAEGNAEPGKFRLARIPYEREPLDDPLDPNISEVGWMIASQVMKTMCVTLIIEYFIDHQATTIMVVYPTLDSAKKWMRDKFIPTVKETPRLRGKLKEPRARDSESTTMNRKFPGGHLTALGANSPSSFRGTSNRVVICDEIDSYEVTSEGDPLALADRAAQSFHNALKWKLSTPKNKGESRIEMIWEKSDKKRFFVPCQFCAHFQHLKWPQFKFSFDTVAEVEKLQKKFPEEPIQTDTLPLYDTPHAVYICENCHEYWTDADRQAAIFDPRAHWRAEFPERTVRGRHLNGLYRLMGKKSVYKNFHHEFAEYFLECKSGGPDKIRVWQNIFLAEPYEEQAKKYDWLTIFQRCEEMDVWQDGADCGMLLPRDVVLLTAAADIHPDRVELLVMGWGIEEEVWAVQKHVIYGNFDLPEMQQRVDEFLFRKWKHPLFRELPIVCAGFDTGHKTKAVYQFCRRRILRKIYAVKGSVTPNAPMAAASARKHYHLTLWNIGTDTAKDSIFTRLEMPQEEIGPRYIHFPKDILPVDEKMKVRTGFNEAFFRQVCSERLVTVKVRGVTTHKWKQFRERNEGLDLLVYNFGAYEILKPNIAAIRKNLLLANGLKEEDVKKLESTEYVLKEKTFEPQKSSPPPKPQIKPAAPRRRRTMGGSFGKWM